MSGAQDNCLGPQKPTDCVTEEIAGSRLDRREVFLKDYVKEGLCPKVMWLGQKEQGIAEQGDRWFLTVQKLRELPGLNGSWSVTK